MNPILSIGEWRNNAELIADVAALGLIPGPVFDATYGLGKFWDNYTPDKLTRNDIHPDRDVDTRWDYREPPPEHLGQYKTVVFDPPYKLNGTPTDSDRYGVHEKVPVHQRIERILTGAAHCAALVAPGGHLLVKVQNQVANGQMYWQVDLVRDVIMNLPGPPIGGWSKQAEFHLAGKPRPQRSQVRARNNYSTLTVYRREEI